MFCGKMEDVSLEKIDLSDESFRISSDNFFGLSETILSDSSPLSRLFSSVKSVGIINPPVLKRLNDNRYIVVCGFRRVNLLKLFSGDSAPDTTIVRAVVIGDDDHPVCLKDLDLKMDIYSDPGSSTDLYCSVLAVSDNAFQRQLTVMEQARSVGLLGRFLTVDRIAELSPMVFNCTLNTSVVKMLCDIASLPVNIHELLDSDRISMGPALRLKSLPEEDIESFYYLFSKIRTGLNKQKEIISNAVEISLREGVSISSVIRERRITQIIDEEGMDENRKGNLVRASLFERRYPALSKAREGFNSDLKMVNLKGGIKIDPPADFEGNEYSVSFRVTDADELRERIESLRAASENPHIEKVLPKRVKKR